MIFMRSAFRSLLSLALLAAVAGIAFSASPAGDQTSFLGPSATPVLNATAEGAKAGIDALQIEIGAAKANHSDTRTAESEYWEAVDAYASGQYADALQHVRNSRAALQATGGAHPQASPVPPTPVGANVFIASLTPSTIIVYGGAIIVVAVVVVFLIGGAKGRTGGKMKAKGRRE